MASSRLLVDISTKGDGRRRRGVVSLSGGNYCDGESWARCVGNKETRKDTADARCKVTPMEGPRNANATPNRRSIGGRMYCTVPGSRDPRGAGQVTVFVSIDYSGNGCQQLSRKINARSVRDATRGKRSVLDA